MTTALQGRFVASNAAILTLIAGAYQGTALREQLGLGLEAARAPVDVLVTDHVERPSAN